VRFLFDSEIENMQATDPHLGPGERLPNYNPFTRAHDGTCGECGNRGSCLFTRWGHLCKTCAETHDLGEARHDL